MRGLIIGVVLAGLIGPAAAQEAPKTFAEAVKQVAIADRLVLTKGDLADTPARQAAKMALLSRIKALNPAAPVLDAAAGEATPDRLLDCGLYDPASKSSDVNRWLADEAYADARHSHAAAQQKSCGGTAPLC